MKATPIKKAKKSAPKPYIDTLAPTACVARVNGEALTVADFHAVESMKAKIWALAQGYPLDPFNEETRKFVSKRRMATLSEMIRNVLIRQFAATNAITAHADRVKARRNECLKAMKRPKGGFDGAVAAFGERDGAELRRFADQAALTDAVLQSLTTNDLFVVTDQEISNYVAFVAAVNKVADEKNAESFAKARLAKAEIDAFIASNRTTAVSTNRLADAKTIEAFLEDTNTVFATVARKYADTNAWEGVSWETFELGDFEPDDPLLAWLIRAEVGDVTEPMELDDGIAVVGLKFKAPIEREEEGNVVPQYEYELVRCYFNYYEKLPEFSRREDVLADIREARWTSAMDVLRERLTKDAVIEFPSGRNLFYPKKSKKKSAKKAGAKEKSAKRAAAK